MSHVALSAHENTPLRVGAICLIAGSLAVFGFRAAHGDLPAATPQAALRFIASRPFYRMVHLGTILGVVTWVAGFVLLAQSFTNSTAKRFSQLGLATMLLGAAIFCVDFAIDGYAGQALGAAWANATVVRQAALTQAAFAVFTALGGTSLVSIGLLWGVPVLLFGRALSLEGYPSWVSVGGWLLGAVAALASFAQFIQPGLIPGFLIYGPLVFLVQLWSFALGILMWRRPVNGNVSSR